MPRPFKVWFTPSSERSTSWMISCFSDGDSRIYLIRLAFRTSPSFFLQCRGRASYQPVILSASDFLYASHPLHCWLLPVSYHRTVVSYRLPGTLYSNGRTGLGCIPYFRHSSVTGLSHEWLPWRWESFVQRWIVAWSYGRCLWQSFLLWTSEILFPSF